MQDACVILGVRKFIYTSTNICPRVEQNLIKSVYTAALTCSFIHLFVPFWHTQWRNVDGGCWRTWRRGRC
jgi:hypothetical protein